MSRKIIIACSIEIVVTLLLFSCYTEVQKDYIPFESKPTINCTLVDGEPIKMHVSMATVIDTPKIASIEDAKVDLFIDGAFYEQLRYTDDGYYLSEISVRPVVEYFCKVNSSDFEEISSSQILPPQPKILNIEHINIAGKDEEGTSYPAIKLTFENLLVEDVYYEAEIRCIRSEERISFAEIHTIQDPVILNEGMPIALFSNEIITDSVYTLNLNYTTNSARSKNGGPWRTKLFPLVVELRRVTEDYYRYKKQLYLYKHGQSADGIITSMTNSNLYSNVNNGYGIFAGYSATVSDTITPNLDGYYD